MPTGVIHVRLTAASPLSDKQALQIGKTKQHSLSRTVDPDRHRNIQAPSRSCLYPKADDPNQTKSKLRPQDRFAKQRG